MRKKLWPEHGASGRLDPKMSLFISLSGAAGYGFYWAILETLSMQNECKLSLDSDVLAVGMTLGLSREEGTKIAELAISCDLFRAEEGKLWHEGLSQTQPGRDERRQRIAIARSIAGKKGGRFRVSKGPNKRPKIGDLPISGNGQKNTDNPASQKSISKTDFCLYPIVNEINELEQSISKRKQNDPFCLYPIGNEIKELEGCEKQQKSISKQQKSISKTDFCLYPIANEINELEQSISKNQAKSSKTALLLIVPPPPPSPLPPPYNPPPTPLPSPPPLFSFSLSSSSSSIFDPDPKNVGIRKDALTTEGAETQCLAYANALPERLDTPEIRETLGRWLYRQVQLGRTRDQLAIDAITAQWAERPDMFLRSMLEGIANSWKVLIEPQKRENQSKYGFQKETNQEISMRNIRSVK